jgi:hypothetical protein
MTDSFMPPPRQPVKMVVKQLTFIGEQSGPPEQLLKDRLTEFFNRDRSVQKAYLARINIDDQVGVALCLKSRAGSNQALATKIGDIFRPIFSAHAHLDIMFVNPAQEAALDRVCKPFFRRA